ncbi:thymidylate synthase [bacterium]|nr:thymidylate synthase [bacterium]
MKQYHKLLEDILEHGEDVSDRTGTGTRSIFGYQMRFNLRDGFPAVTTKRLAWKSVVGELLWFLEGSTDERRLAELTFAKDRTELIDKNTIWTANADAQGKSLGYENNDLYKGLGPVYGAQWRNFDGFGTHNGTDQIEWLINEIRTNPDSRRLILSAWNPNQLSQMALPPCHTMAQFRVYNGKLSCQMYQRSADAFLGVPFNIASYALLTHLVARECGLEVGDYVHTIGDAHIYNDHFNQVKEQLSREEYPLPQLEIDEQFELILKGEFNLDDTGKFKLTNYLHHDIIKANMAV